MMNGYLIFYQPKTSIIYAIPQSPHMLKLAIFDLDQTLLDTLPRFHKIFNLSLRHFGCPEVPWDDFERKYKDDTLNDYVCVDRREFWDYFLSHYNDLHCEKDTLIDGAEDTLKELKNLGVNVAIITGRMVPKDEVWKELARFNLDRLVDLVYTRRDNYCDGRRRTELIIEVMKKFNTDRSEVIFIGDYWPDMQSGREAGVLTIGVLTGHENKEKLKENGADVVLGSVADLIPFLKERQLI